MRKIVQGAIAGAAVLALSGGSAAVALAANHTPAPQLPAGATYWCVSQNGLLRHQVRYYEETGPDAPQPCRFGYVLFGVGPAGSPAPSSPAPTSPAPTTAAPTATPTPTRTRPGPTTGR